jgi:hypothetical protein
MSEKVSTIIGDIVRWIIALILLPFVAWLLFLFFMYPFEWLLSKSTNWKWIFHVLFWLILGGGIIRLTTLLGGLISILSTFLVRQSTAYTIIFFIVLLGLVGFCIYGAWSSNVDFSWEFFKYRTFNKLLFTVLALNLLQIPIGMFSSRNE